MSKLAHFRRLAKEMLKLRTVKVQKDYEDYLDCLDCILAVPAACVPDVPSLRWFVSNFIDHFLEPDGSCRLHYRRAAAFVDRWKGRWLPKESGQVGKVGEGRRDGAATPNGLPLPCPRGRGHQPSEVRQLPLSPVSSRKPGVRNVTLIWDGDRVAVYLGDGLVHQGDVPPLDVFCGLMGIENVWEEVEPGLEGEGVMPRSLREYRRRADELRRWRGGG
jgi:hypothetical protein